MLKLLKNIFLYSGVEKEEYESVLPEINRYNRSTVIIFSGLATVLIAAMCIISVFLQSTIQNRAVYIFGFLAALGLFITSVYYAKKHREITLYLVYVSFSIFFIYGISIGAITNPSQQTVTFMVMLVFMPVLFADIPLRVAAVELFYELLFIALCHKTKSGSVLSTDIMDAIIYSILGIVSGCIINHIKVRNYVLEKRLHRASRVDQLTGMNNRNSFEYDLSTYAGKCSHRLTCIYIDANGLHELNNTRGHKAGDKMLQFVSEHIRSEFGAENTYRIGGDEFVAFIPDADDRELSSRIDRLSEKADHAGYHIAIGYESMERESLDIDVLIKDAETKMYLDKATFYRHSGYERRQYSENK